MTNVSVCNGERRKSDAMWASLIGGVLLLFSFSRGAFELVMSKPAAYALQLGIIFIWFLWGWTRGWLRKDIAVGAGFLALFVSVIAAFISAVATVAMTQQLGAVFYFFIYVIVCIFLCIPRFFSQGPLVLSLVYSVFFAILGLEIVATFQQLGFLAELPGGSPVYESFIRPPSLTGSMLHYPIISAIGSIIILDFGLRLGNKKLLISSVFLLIGVVGSYSRSGILIIGISLFLIAGRSLNRRHVKTLGFMIGLVGVGFGAIAYFSNELVVGYFDRALAIFDLEDVGNASRLETWSQAISLINSGPVLFSDTTGFYTNATANFNLSSESFVAESSLLLFILNFGVISGFLFYFSFFLFLKNCRLSIAGNALLIAVMVQSLIYQSFEVLPFIFILAVALALARVGSFPRPSYSRRSGANGINL